MQVPLARPFARGSNGLKRANFHISKPAQMLVIVIWRSLHITYSNLDRPNASISLLGFWNWRVAAGGGLSPVALHPFFLPFPWESVSPPPSRSISPLLSESFFSLFSFFYNLVCLFSFLTPRQPCPYINDKLRFAVNGVSSRFPLTPSEAS